VQLAEGPTVLMVAHRVFQAAGSAFADIELAPPGSYSPLVQLALARFQRASLPGLAISPVVRTDFVPVLPDRTVTISVTGAEITVLLQGLAPSGPRRNRVDAVLERRADPAAATGALTVGADGTWEQIAVASGGVDQSLQLTNPGGEVRVRVREVEMIGRDTSPAFGTVQELEERVVFTDVVVL
jgi:hypothetical protein